MEEPRFEVSTSAYGSAGDGQAGEREHGDSAKELPWGR